MHTLQSLIKYDRFSKKKKEKKNQIRPLIYLYSTIMLNFVLSIIIIGDGEEPIVGILIVLVSVNGNKAPQIQ